VIGNFSPRLNLVWVGSGMLSLAALVALPGVTAAATGPDPTAARPNLVVILADDLGFADLGCYGGEIPTPHLDALAARGLRFTQFYNTARCCPTRASLLTGLYPHQAGVGYMVYHDHGHVAPGYRGHLHDGCVTIAEVLQAAGYFTAMTGKWHVGQNHGVVPWERGFKRTFTSPKGGFYFSECAGWDKPQLFLNGRDVDPHGPELPPDWYSTDLWTQYGLQFIDEARAAEKPFFLYVAHNAPHFPLQAPPDAIARFRGRYAAGWDELGAHRYARQLHMGIIAPAWAKAPRPPTIQAWESLSPEDRDRFDHIMAIYAAVVHRLDASVGNLVAGLEERGLLDDTLILFLSDNGGNPEGGPDRQPKKPIASGPDGSALGPGPLGSGNSQVWCGESWAWLQNTPFRRYKHYVHEGGIATPLIAHWPAGIAARGELRTQPGHVVDIMATCVELAGAEYPATSHGETIPPPEGRSLLPAFANQTIDRGAIFWEHEGNAAVRQGIWKLVRLGRQGAWELYDLEADRTELHDLAAAHPERVRELAAAWEAWADHARVRPYPTPPKKNKKKPQAAPQP